MKPNHLRRLLLVPFLLLCLQAYSQSSPSSFNLKNMVPTSPEAAMLGRFGDIPIGYYTGTADVSIPIYTIKEGGIELPIVLRYHGSGIRVEDEASNVGLGWSLEAEGAIIQIINGKEDRLDQLISYDPAGYATLKSSAHILGSYSERSVEGTAVWGVNSCGLPNTPGDALSTFLRLEQGDGQSLLTV